MKKIILITFLLASLSIVCGQNVTVKSPAGNGPELSVSLAGLVAYPTSMGAPPEQKYAFISFSLNGMIPTAYKYNGKTYPIPFYGDQNENCLTHIYLSESSDHGLLTQSVTVAIRVKGKIYTRTAKAYRNFNFTIPLDEVVKKEDVTPQNVVSITVEPRSSGWIEGRLEQYEQCLKLKENEKKAKAEAEKETKGQQTAKKEDDFWAGGEERKLTIVVPEGKSTDAESGKGDANTAEGNKITYKAGVVKDDRNNHSNATRWSQNGYWWVEDKEGNLLIPKQKRDVFELKGYSEDVALVWESYGEEVWHGSYVGYYARRRRNVLIDQNGTKINFPYEDFNPLNYYNVFVSEGLIGGWVSGVGHGFVDKKGNIVIPFRYESGTENFSEGLAKVVKSGKHGFIDKTDKEVIPLQYDNASSFSEGLASVKLNDKWGFVNKAGNEVIPLQYDEASPFSEGKARVKLNDKWGFVDKTGVEVIPLQYISIGRFENGKAQVTLDARKYFYIDKNGNEVN